MDLIGYNDGDFRFFSKPQETGTSDNWDEARNFKSVEEAISYWESTDYLEMHQVSKIGNQIHFIPYEY